jgi:hypothetical protein
MWGALSHLPFPLTRSNGPPTGCKQDFGQFREKSQIGDCSEDGAGYRGEVDVGRV